MRLRSGGEDDDDCGRSQPLAHTQTTAAKNGKKKGVRIYEHSDLMYWWIVWLYGFICAGLTYFQGKTVQIDDQSVFVVHPDSWVSISMIGLILFVVIFTNEKARGAYSLILVLSVLLIAGLVYVTHGWQRIIPLFQLLRVYANPAFYLTLSVPLFIVWTVMTLGFDRLNYWDFLPGEVGRRNVVGEGSDHWVPQNFEVKRLSHDLFVHRILGLWFLGLGTGDLEIAVSTSHGQMKFTLRNIWRVGAREKQINQMIITKEMVQSAN